LCDSLASEQQPRLAQSRIRTAVRVAAPQAPAIAQAMHALKPAAHQPAGHARVTLALDPGR